MESRDEHDGFDSREEFLTNQHRESMRLQQEQHQRELKDSNASTMGFIALGVIIFIAIALGWTDK